MVMEIHFHVTGPKQTGSERRYSGFGLIHKDSNSLIMTWANRGGQYG